MIAVSTAGVTVKLVVPDTPATVAIIVALPIPVPVTSPGLTVLATVAIVSEEEIQLDRSGEILSGAVGKGPGRGELCTMLWRGRIRRSDGDRESVPPR